ncbi:MAG: cyclic di-AMP binding protein CbpA [Lactobacillus sp.]|nr:cyclic di-AMP binding protein CbpA [Lactobacillus sp.]
MLIKSLVKKKDYLTTVNENATLEDALKILEDSGYRCVPILDDSGTIFRGNIYKMHLYRHKSQGGDMSLPVTHLLKNATKTIHVNSPFFKVFFNIRDLPYIAVLDKDNKFYGILTHTKLLEMLSTSWNMNDASYVLTVLSGNKKGTLSKITKIIAKYSSIAGAMVLDSGKGSLSADYVRRTLITLPSDVDIDTLHVIVNKLVSKGYVVAEIEDLKSGHNIMSDENPGVWLNQDHE